MAMSNRFESFDDDVVRCCCKGILDFSIIKKKITHSAFFIFVAHATTTTKNNTVSKSIPNMVKVLDDPHRRCSFFFHKTIFDILSITILIIIKVISHEYSCVYG